MSTAAGMSNRVQYSTAALGGNANQITLQLSDEAWYSATATGTRTAALSGSKDNIGQLLALTPAVAPTSSTISYVGVSNISGTTSVSLPVPSGVQVGDLLLVAYATRKSTVTITPPPSSSWNEIRNDPWDASNLRQAVYWRIATSVDAAGNTYTWGSNDGTSKATGIMAAYRGVDQSAPVHLHDWAKNARTVTVTAPSLTPTRSDTRLIGLFGATDGNTITTGAAGMTSRKFSTTGTGGTDVTLEFDDQRWPSAGATGTRDITLSSTGRGIGQMLALKAESYPLAALSWTASTSTYAGGYRLGREVGGTETVATELTPRTLTSYTVGNTNRLTGGVSYTMKLKTRATNWLSPAASVTFTAQSTC
jgi:hypothetical protein